MQTPQETKAVFLALVARCSEEERRALEGYIIAKDRESLAKLITMLVKKYRE